MKKSVIISAGVAMIATLVSCNQKEPYGSGLVRFRILSSETKSAVVTTESINKNDNEFVVDLFNTATKEVVGTNFTATHDGNEWQLDPQIYWDWRTLDAWARYPKALTSGAISSINGISVNSERTEQTFNFLTHYNESESPRKDADKQDDLLFACSKGCKYSDNEGRIHIEFAHALAAVYFKVAAEDGTNLELGDDVIINSLELAGIKRAGTCTYNPSLTDEARFAWDVTETEGGPSRAEGSYVQTYDQKALGGTFLGGDSFETANCFFVIPQAMTDKAALTVNWSKNGAARDSRTASIYKSKDKNGNENVVEWKAGYKYLYTLKIKNRGAEVDVDIKVLDWNGVESDIKFGDTAAASADLTFDATTAKIEGNRIVFITNTTAVKGQFQLSSPEDGQWAVTLSNSLEFDLCEMVNGAPVRKGALLSGPISDAPAEFYILPKDGIDTSVSHETKVFISAVRSDGETIKADDVLKNTYTIVLNGIK